MILRKSNIDIHLIVVLILFAGILEWFGISQGLTKLVVLIIGMFCWIRSWNKYHFVEQKFTVLVLSWMGFTAIASANKYGLDFIIPFIQVFGPIIFFVFVINTTNRIEANHLTTVAQIFVITQVSAALIKFLLVGQSEGLGIGTISIQAGSLSTLIAVYICYIATQKTNINYKFILLFSALGFAFVNEKRLGILLVLCFIFIETLNLKIKPKRFRPLYILCSACFLLAILPQGLKLIPSILEGNSLSYLPMRVFHYLTATDSSGMPIGRIAGFIYTLGNFQSIGEVLFGKNIFFSFSSAIYSYSEVGDNLNFRPSAFLISLMRFGIFGSFLLLYVLYFILQKIEGKGALLFKLYLLIDFLIYSDNLFVNYVYIGGLMVFFMGSIIGEREKSSGHNITR